MTPKEIRQDRRLYGRRQARPLRKGRKALLEDLLPTVSFEPGADPASLFAERKSEHWLEIGFGAGEHLAAQAAAHPEVGLLGVEFFVDGVASMLRYIEEQDLSNVRLHRGDGRAVLEALPDASMARVFLLHPDPWPKRRHARRRFVQPQTLDQFARVLPAGGELRIATDHPAYLDWTLMHMAARDVFRWRATRADDWRRRPEDWPGTRYGEKAEREGRRCTYLRYLRI